MLRKKKEGIPQGFNRTIEELKPICHTMNDKLFQSFNRTIEELKHELNLLSDQAFEVLIAP